MAIKDATPAQMKVAEKLSKMANSNDFTYTPTGKVDKVDHVVWHGMTATRTSDGATWDYWLRRDYGSYAGGF